MFYNLVWNYWGLVDESTKGIKKINKPAKIYFNNTNLLFAYCNSSEIGTIRETFFANQVISTNKLNISKNGDFLVGGKNKTYKQIKYILNSYIVSDDIEIGFRNKIPLWLFILTETQ